MTEFLLRNARIHPEYTLDTTVLEKCALITTHETVLNHSIYDTTHRLFHVLLGSSQSYTAAELTRLREFFLLFNDVVCKWEPRWVSAHNAAIHARVTALAGDVNFVGKDSDVSTAADDNSTGDLAPIDYRSMTLTQSFTDDELRRLFRNHEFINMLERVAEFGYVAALDGQLSRGEEQSETDKVTTVAAADKAAAANKKRKIIMAYGAGQNYWPPHRKWYTTSPAEDPNVAKCNLADIAGYLMTSFAQSPYEPRDVVTANKTDEAISNARAVAPVFPRTGEQSAASTTTTSSCFSDTTSATTTAASEEGDQSKIIAASAHQQETYEPKTPVTISSLYTGGSTAFSTPS